MSVREGLSFDTRLRSDVAPLNDLVDALLTEVPEVRFMRDPTRGGLSGLLADLAVETALSIEIGEEAIPISRVAHHTAEMLGLDPLAVANEGKVVMVVPAPAA
jgi:hydrogenase expression/formation protein HypE